MCRHRNSILHSVELEGTFHTWYDEIHVMKNIPLSYSNKNHQHTAYILSWFIYLFIPGNINPAKTFPLYSYMNMCSCYLVSKSSCDTTGDSSCHKYNITCSGVRELRPVTGLCLKALEFEHHSVTWYMSQSVIQMRVTEHREFYHHIEAWRWI